METTRRQVGTQAGAEAEVAERGGLRAEKSWHILRAAAKVFARSGYFNSKVSDVAREAGIADGTVYLYFKSKDELLSSIFSAAMDEFIRRARAELAGIVDPREQLRHFAYLHFASLERDRDLAIVFQIELRQSTKFMEQFSSAQLAEYFQIIREIIETGQQRGLFRPQLSARLVAKFLFGALDEMATNWVISHSNASLTAMVDPVMEIFFNGVSSNHAQV
ncbi:MAG: TetR/AcrR family transcriptional regulator [Acidobacteria bacterium]|nr:TetR/AcrR family transcriptional regulator [Acidobacteriota bacterium]MCW5968227.1 TetR/AcrR family transcriptional regulator [Blastocatellales bacterium]